MNALLIVVCLCFAPAAPQETGAPPEPAEPITLPDGVVASVDAEPISNGAFLAYLGTVNARNEKGRNALRQILVEQLLDQRAEQLSIEVSEDDIVALYDRYEAKAREASGGERSLLDNAGGPGREQALHDTLRLAVLQRAVVAAEDGVAAESLDNTRLSAWLTQALQDAGLEEQPLADPLAARWTGGEIPRTAVGLQLTRTLPDAEVSAVLTELIGIVAIFHRARALGLEYTPDAAAQELAQREALVSASPEASGLTYAALLSQVEGLTTRELVSSPRFQAEVLVGTISRRQADEQLLADLFEELHDKLVERFGENATLEQSLPLLQKEARQRAYRQIVESSTIVRRF